MARYRADLAREDFQYDSAQQRAVEHLQRLYDELLSTPRQSLATRSADKGLTSRVASLFGRKSAAVPEPAEPTVMGLYLWGGVGRGKT